MIIIKVHVSILFLFSTFRINIIRVSTNQRHQVTVFPLRGRCRLAPDDKGVIFVEPGDSLNIHEFNLATRSRP